jgi:oxygen-independent coproporphyrinogen-3 oxidase
VADLPLEAEITAEANPTDRDQFGAINAVGINRLSLGFQSLDDRDLKSLGRLHDSAAAVSSFQAAREAGFGNIGVDLIFGAPGQSVTSWEATLDRTIALEPEHISIYGLTVEPGTAFHRRAAKGQLELPGEGEQADMYEGALDRLVASGHAQYEVSNFARPGYESRHNIGYWEGRPYLGLGLSAHSFVDGRRSWNKRDLTSYIDSVESSGTAVEDTEVLSATTRLHERIMLGLRRSDGVPEDLLAGGGSASPLQRLVDGHLLKRSGGRVRLTRRGLLLADLVCAEFMGMGEA